MIRQYKFEPRQRNPIVETSTYCDPDNPRREGYGTLQYEWDFGDGPMFAGVL